MPRLDLTSLRYFASVASIAVGVSLLAYVALRNDSNDGVEPALASTPQAQSEATPEASPTPAPPPTPTPPPSLPPPPPLIKGTPNDCHRNWRFIDNPQQRWTVCLPANLLYQDSRGVLPFEAASAEDWGAITREFVVVNEAWILNQNTTTRAPSDVLGPIHMKVEVAPPTLALDGCPIRDRAPDARGAVTCGDRMEPREPGPWVLNPEGSVLRIRALVPTRPDAGVRDVFSLYLTFTGYNVNWPLQEQLFQDVLESLKPY